VIERVGVVVPARNEQLLLPRCLDALAAAVDAVQALGDVAVDVVAVLDRCTDGSAAAVADRPWVRAVEVDAGNVGLARSVGCAEVLRSQQSGRMERLWLASTDADSRVPADWLTTQLVLAAQGAEVVLGTVDVDDWEDHPSHVQHSWRSAYVAAEGHPHVHGANVGCRADAYVAAGGFLALSCDEDVALVSALARDNRRSVRTATIPVLTSARQAARAAGGFAGHLAALG
jgi:glycosyltransferase involved in cell wall biosynthesis